MGNILKIFDKKKQCLGINIRKKKSIFKYKSYTSLNSNLNTDRCGVVWLVVVVVVVRFSCIQHAREREIVLTAIRERDDLHSRQITPECRWRRRRRWCRVSRVRSGMVRAAWGEGCAKIAGFHRGRVFRQSPSPVRWDNGEIRFDFRLYFYTSNPITTIMIIIHNLI